MTSENNWNKIAFYNIKRFKSVTNTVICINMWYTSLTDQLMLNTYTYYKRMCYNMEKTKT